MRRHLRLGALACLLAAGTATLAACSGGGDDNDDQDDDALDALQDVTVTGPVTGGTRPNAFAEPTVDLEASGYVAEEFFYEGQATAYQPAPGARLAADGRWDLRPAGEASFKTRMLVMRPMNAEDFSGTVWLSWLNVTAGFEIGDLTPEGLRDGDAVVPELEVPIATYRGTAEGEDVMSSLFGTMTPFPPERLRALYPSRVAYLDAYDEAVDQAVEAGYVLDRDADSIKQAAATNATDLLPG